MFYYNHEGPAERNMSPQSIPLYPLRKCGVKLSDYSATVGHLLLHFYQKMVLHHAVWGNRQISLGNTFNKYLGQTANKLHLVKPLLGKWDSSSQNSCKVGVILCGLRIGYTYLTRRFLPCGDDLPQCEHCEASLLVLHILCVCSSLLQMQAIQANTNYNPGIFRTFSESTFLFILVCSWEKTLSSWFTHSLSFSEKLTFYTFF